MKVIDLIDENAIGTLWEGIDCFWQFAEEQVVEFKADPRAYKTEQRLKQFAMMSRDLRFSCQSDVECELDSEVPNG